jgi:YD repeat-containing protein
LFSDGDSLLFQPTIDGFARARDEVGNVTRTRLLVRLPGQSSPALVAANLKYDLLGRLARVERDDGVTVLNEYDAQGNRIRRRVSGDPSKCVPSDVAFIYDGRTLLEERDLSHNAVLLARFYYLDGAPVAADADYSGSGTLQRYYFLTDQLGSVRAVHRRGGTVLERVNYEAWGQPLIQSADTKAPRVSRVLRAGSDLVLVFSEPVLPPLVNDGSTTNLLPALKDLGSLIAADQGGTAIPGTAVLEESFSGMPFGTCVRFKAAVSLAGSINLHVTGGLVDEWGNPNPYRDTDREPGTGRKCPVYRARFGQHSASHRFAQRDWLFGADAWPGV